MNDFEKALSKGSARNNDDDDLGRNVSYFDGDQTRSDDDTSEEPEHLRKIFVGGLDHRTTDTALKLFYEQWGKIVDVIVMKDPHTKRSRGFGFVTYSHGYMVDEAMNARPHTIDDKLVDPKRAVPREENRGTRFDARSCAKKIFVAGLRDEIDEEDLKNYFSSYGNVVSILLVSDKETGKKRGFGFVEFDDYDTVDIVCRSTHTIKGKLLDIKKGMSREELARNKARMGNGPLPQRQNQNWSKNYVSPASASNYDQWNNPSYNNRRNYGGNGGWENGLGYQDNTQGYQNNVQGYQNNAQGYQNDAQGYQNNAQGYQNNVQGYQNNAHGYQNNGQGYQNNDQGYASGPVATTSYENRGWGYAASSATDYNYGYQQPQQQPYQYDEYSSGGGGPIRTNVGGVPSRSAPYISSGAVPSSSGLQGNQRTYSTSNRDY